EIFAPVVKPMTLRTVLAGVAVKGWHVKQMDITTAFLNGILLEDIYMAQPDGYEDGTSQMYAAVHTQPDASFGVGQLARVVQRPTEEQLEVAKRLVRYLGSTASAGVQFSAGGQLKQIGADAVMHGTLKLSCFTDATWTSEDEDQSSVGGFVCMVGEIVLLRKLLEDMGAEQEGPTPLLSDSEAAIGMANNPILNGLNKHMKIKWHWVRQMMKEGIVELHHVKASKQAADFLTKRLPESAHWKCAKMCGMALH
ncbi:unnamed protein product, partial [Closterium sp. NIES-54]